MKPRRQVIESFHRTDLRARGGALVDPWPHEGSTHWVTFPASLLDPPAPWTAPEDPEDRRAEAIRLLDYWQDCRDLDSAITARGFYGGPGRLFAHPPDVRIGRSRVLITQRHGLDV